MWMGMEECEKGKCPGYGIVSFTNSYWDCERCGAERIFGSHECPKIHNHPVPPVDHGCFNARFAEKESDKDIRQQAAKEP